MNENNQIDDSLKIDGWRFYFKKAMIRAFLVFAIGLVAFLLFGLSVLVFYILIVVALIFGNIKYWEYTLPVSFNKLNKRIKNE